MSNMQVSGTSLRLHSIAFQANSLSLRKTMHTWQWFWITMTSFEPMKTCFRQYPYFLLCACVITARIPMHVWNLWCYASLKTVILISEYGLYYRHLSEEVDYSHHDIMSIVSQAMNITSLKLTIHDVPPNTMYRKIYRTEKTVLFEI